MLLRAAGLVLLVAAALHVQVGVSERDSCDVEDATLRRLCRKIESQEKYQEKWVAANFKTETVFRWYSANKEWLTNPRLKRMMTRLLRRAAALNPTESDDFSDSDTGNGESVSSPAAGSAAASNLAAQLEQMTQRVDQMARQLTEAHKQLESVRQIDGLESRVNASLAAHHEQLKLQANLTNQSLQHVVSSSEQLAARVTKAEKLVQNLKSSPANCSCSLPARVQLAPVTAHSESAANETEDSSGRTEDIQRLKWQVEREIEQLQLKLQLTSTDLEKSIHTVQTHNEGALRNFSASFQDSMRTFATLLDDKLSSVASSSYDVITNTTLAFGEDLQVLRQAVSASAAQVQFLVGQDLKTVRGLEEMRSNNRRHENNIQVITTQLGEFKFQMQDQLNSIRNHFTQAVNEFYQKIVERQNSMTYRLGSVVDDLQAVKNRMRNLPVVNVGQNSTTGDVVVAVDDDETLVPLQLEPLKRR